MYKVYIHVGQELEKLKVPVGGDQLTRVRLDGAKALILGAHTPQERLDGLFPVIVELFHTQMDFFEVFFILSTSSLTRHNFDTTLYA